METSFFCVLSKSNTGRQAIKKEGREGWVDVEMQCMQRGKEKKWDEGRRETRGSVSFVIYGRVDVESRSGVCDEEREEILVVEQQHKVRSWLYTNKSLEGRSGRMRKVQTP